MRKYLYFLTGDARHLQARLERLAQKGLELISLEGFFTGEFEPTNRVDLRYLVLPCGKAAERLDPEHYTSFGWELMGTFNGMAVFRSLPCEDADADGAKERMVQDGCFHPDRIGIPLFLLCCLGLTLALLRLTAGAAWYASYTQLALRGLAGAAAAVAAANVLSLRSYVSAWVHGLTPMIVVSGVVVFICGFALDNRKEPAILISLMVLLAAACILMLWGKNRAFALSLSGFCLVILCLGLLFPGRDRSVLVTGPGTEAELAAIRYEVADRPVVCLEDVGLGDEPKAASYETSGTLLVREYSYLEYNEDGCVQSDVYVCLTMGIAQQVYQDLLENAWGLGEYDMLLCEGRTVARVTCSEPIEGQSFEFLFQ